MRYRPAVVRLARSIVGADHAEDVAQDSLLLAFKALPGIEEPRKFPAWLSAITRHRALRFSKSETAQMSKRVALDEALLEQIEALREAACREGTRRRNDRGARKSSCGLRNAFAVALSGRDAAEPHCGVYGSSVVDGEVENSSRQETVANQD